MRLGGSDCGVGSRQSLDKLRSKGRDLIRETEYKGKSVSKLIFVLCYFYLGDLACDNGIRQDKEN